MKEFFKEYSKYYLEYKSKLAIIVIAMIVIALTSSATAYVIKPILDDIFINKDEHMLKILPLFVVGIYFAKGVGRYFQAYYTAYIGQDITRKVRDNLFLHTIKLDFQTFNSFNSGELISRITNDINRIQLAVSSYLAEIIRESLTIIALVGLVIYQNSTLAFYALVVMPLALYPLSRLAKRMKKISFKSQEKISTLTSHLSEVFQNIELIKVYQSEGFEKSRFKQHNQEFFNLNMKSVKTNELTSPLMETVGAMAVALVIIVGGQEVIDGTMSVGEFFSFITALFMLYTPIKKVSKVYNKFQDAIAANERIKSMFKLSIEEYSKKSPKITKVNSIIAKNLALNINDKKIINNLSFEINSGDLVAISGPSGSGKSSLIYTLLKFYKPTSGDILIDSNSINDISINSLRDAISIVTQRVYIFDDTVINNISYGSKVDEDRVIKALKKANAWEFVSKLEDGIYTQLRENGSNLSGGQRQRVAIARAIYRDSPILIFDEATSALDGGSESLITENIKELAKNRVVFIIAHREESIKFCNKVIKLASSS
jgi:subfamily B ATP-binding cassette protein MsbA